MITIHRADEDDGTAQLSYGRDAAGTLRHISEVPSGLACNCVCPGCEARLIARKGEIRAPNFAHYVNTACQGAWETTLHLLAKQLTTEGTEILLPPVVATLGNSGGEIYPATRFRYDSAEEEVIMPAPEGEQGRTVIPDIILRGGDRVLLVEFEVKHACEPEKIAELHRRRLPTIEVDLKRIPRHASREEHAAMIAAAPRKWLFNRFQEDALQGLRLEAKRRIAAETRLIRSALNAPRSTADETDVARMIDAGLGNALALPIEGSRCFRVDDRIWQAAMLADFIFRAPGYRWTVDGLLAALGSGEMLKSRISNATHWDPAVIDRCRAEIEGFRMPAEVVADYCKGLVDREILGREPGGWRVIEEVATRAATTLKAAIDRKTRLQEVRRLVGTVLARAKERRAVSPDYWMQATLSEFGATPAAIAVNGGAAYETLAIRLKKLADMAVQGGPDLPPEQHLGLPLAAEGAARLAEREARELARGISDAAFAERAAAKRRDDTVKFLATAWEETVADLGEELGRAEMARALAEAGVTIEGNAMPAEIDWTTRRKIEGVLSQARWQRQEAAEIEGRRRAEEDARLAAIARCRGELEDAALTYFRRDVGRSDPGQQAQVWLKSTQPTLGASPWAYATDRERLARCLNLLAAGCKGRR